MKLNRIQLRKLIMEMAVAPGIRSGLQPNQRTVLIPYELDASKISAQQTTHFKPTGLWYGFGTSWMDFAKTAGGIADMYWNSEYLYEVQIATTSLNAPDSNKVLRMTTYDEMNQFFQQYPAQRAGSFKMINWPVIARDFAGIELVGDAKSEIGGWDIDSGCIWNPAALTGHRQLQNPDTPDIPTRQTPGAASGTLTADPNEMSYDNLSEELKEMIEDYDDDHEWEGYTQANIEEDIDGRGYLDSDSYSNIWEVLADLHSSGSYGGEWFERAAMSRASTEVLANVIGAIHHIVKHYDSDKNNVGGAVDIIYSLSSNVDKADALANINAFLQEISDTFALGLTGIDIDYDNEWNYASRDF